MVGRSTLYGVAAAGEAGAARALEIFHEEIRRNMALLGVNTIGELGPQYLKFIDPTAAPHAGAGPRRGGGQEAVGEANPGDSTNQIRISGDSMIITEKPMTNPDSPICSPRAPLAPRERGWG